MIKTNYQEVVKQSARDTAVLMTAQLRQECIASGWSPEVANRVSVKFSNGTFAVHIPDSIKSQVDNLEYGTPSTQPTAAIRRFGNRADSAESFLLKRAKQLLGGSL